jgi:hypothetical protein
MTMIGSGPIAFVIVRFDDEALSALRTLGGLLGDLTI